MKFSSRFRMLFLCSLVSAFAPSIMAEDTNIVQTQKLVITHADAAMILAKYSGLFDRYVDADASLNECVAFLNKTGVYFGLMEVVNECEFTMEDCARVMGQLNLVFSGEAEYLGGKVKLPKGIDSWQEFCIMNNIDYVHGYQTLTKTLVLMAQMFNR